MRAGPASGSGGGAIRVVHPVHTGQRSGIRAGSRHVEVSRADAMVGCRAEWSQPQGFRRPEGAEQSRRRRASAWYPAISARNPPRRAARPAPWDWCRSLAGRSTGICVRRRAIARPSAASSWPVSGRPSERERTASAPKTSFRPPRHSQTGGRAQPPAHEFRVRRHPAGMGRRPVFHPWPGGAAPGHRSRFAGGHARSRLLSCPIFSPALIEQNKNIWM